MLGLSGVTQIVAGYTSAYALLSNGTVRAWGDGSQYRLGTGSTGSRSVPTSIAALSGVTALSAGFATGYALLSDGTVKAWGSNTSGQIGNGTTTTPTTPVTATGLAGNTVTALGREAARGASMFALVS